MLWNMDPSSVPHLHGNASPSRRVSMTASRSHLGICPSHQSDGSWVRARNGCPLLHFPELLPFAGCQGEVSQVFVRCTLLLPAAGRARGGPLESEFGGALGTHMASPARSRTGGARFAGLCSLCVCVLWGFVLCREWLLLLCAHVHFPLLP